MPDRRPRVFIGSASESSAVADTLQELLTRDGQVEATVWHALNWSPGRSVLEELQSRLDQFDCGIFILTGDDAATIRGRTLVVPRDNVLLELGMFIGRRGRSQSFFVLPDDPSLAIPSDLNGIVHVRRFDHQRFREKPSEATAVMSTVASQIRRELPKVVSDPEPPMRLLRSDTEVAGEFATRVKAARSTVHEAILTWTIPHLQSSRDEYRNIRDALLTSNGFDLRQVVIVHHRQHYEEVLGMLSRFGHNPRYAVRFLPPSRPALPMLNYWAFDLCYFYFEASNFDRGRIQTTTAFAPEDQSPVREELHGYFDDLWRHASDAELASGGAVSWDSAADLARSITVDPLEPADAAQLVNYYRTTDFEKAKWVNARLVQGEVDP